MIPKNWMLIPDKETHTKDECCLALTRLMTDWRIYSHLDINLWIYEFVINYGCIYAPLICLPLLEIPLKTEWTVEQKYRRINELFKQEAQRLTRIIKIHL